jgi:3D (Asp-Asp-Asp) domain-containing protein
LIKMARTFFHAFATPHFVTKMTYLTGIPKTMKYVLLFLGLLCVGLVQGRCDMDRPHEVFIPDPEGGGWWFPIHPGESVEKQLERGGISRHLIQEILEQIHEGKTPKPSRSAQTALAAITCYWSQGKGTDRWTRKGQSSTRVKLTRGVVAVDPRLIPYGSLIKITGVSGYFVAADRGGDVIRRVAAKKTARTADEKKAIVVDVYFRTEQEGRSFDRSLPRFVKIEFYPPTT